MPFPRASQALSRFTVLDRTRVRSGPTCERQLADGGQCHQDRCPARGRRRRAAGGPAAALSPVSPRRNFSWERQLANGDPCSRVICLSVRAEKLLYSLGKVNPAAR
jgi:hypothetical protein